MVIYSTVTIDSVEFQDKDGILNPVPLGPVGLNREISPISRINPQELNVTGDAPLTTEPAFVIAIHATDPLVGPDPPQGPDGGNASPSQALSNIIGLQVRQAGSYDDIDVPIFPTPQVFPLSEGESSENSLQPGQTFPPNPDGDTDVAATLWYFEQPDGEELPPFVPAPLTDDGTPIQGTATIGGLDKNEDVPPAIVEEETVPTEPIDGGLEPSGET